MVEFGHRGDDGYFLLAADEYAACLCFSCEEDDVIEDFKNDLDGAVERRASGGGVAEVKDADDATACLGEDEVSCVRFDIEDHVACVESDDCVGVGMEVVHEICAFRLSVGCCCLLLAADLV